MSHGHAAPAKPLKPRRITQDMVLRATSLTKSSKESVDQYLQRVTHLHLQSKRIRHIENLDQCTNLKVLYLYDNQIDEIKNLEFASIVQYLLLQNNKIKEIPHLPMPSLRKLYLDENEIEYVSGLEECERLEELHVRDQRIPSFTGLAFDPASLQALGKFLQVLEITGNAIQFLRPFSGLYMLRKLFAGDNNVTDLAEIACVISLERLEEATFLGNPCCTAGKYRDEAIGASSDALKTFDGLPILRHQQIAIRGLVEHRKKCGFASAIETSNFGGAGGISNADFQNMNFDLAEGSLV
jgi:Leucine-rich repeat (LRR) protein